eukprot:GILK01006303.1.p1 GENE.GILK01006303.1~~GILK01006303.1.p1  ORF type:complete len:585 (-),score=73.52 GILK01006303.1:131-1786(-)
MTTLAFTDNSAGVHNIVVLFLFGAFILWFLRLVRDFVRLAELNIAIQNERVFELDDLGSDARHLESMFRSHFEQLIRAKTVVPATKMGQIKNILNIHKSSIHPYFPEKERACIGVQFTFDAETPCSIECLWGVSATVLQQKLSLFQQTQMAPGARRSVRANLSRGWWQRWRGRRSKIAVELRDIRHLQSDSAVSRQAISTDESFIAARGSVSYKSPLIFCPAGPKQKFVTLPEHMVPLGSFPLGRKWSMQRQSYVFPLVVVIKNRHSASNHLQQQEHFCQVCIVEFEADPSGSPASPSVNQDAAASITMNVVPDSRADSAANHGPLRSHQSNSQSAMNALVDSETRSVSVSSSASSIIVRPSTPLAAGSNLTRPNSTNSPTAASSSLASRGSRVGPPLTPTSATVLTRPVSAVSVSGVRTSFSDEPAVGSVPNSDSNRTNNNQSNEERTPGGSSAGPVPYNPAHIRQLVITETDMLELQEVFGLGNEDDNDCVICMTDPKDTVLLPCRHACVCSGCFRHIDKCPVCRTAVKSHIEMKKDIKQSEALTVAPL